MKKRVLLLTLSLILAVSFCAYAQEGGPAAEQTEAAETEKTAAAETEKTAAAETEKAAVAETEKTAETETEKTAVEEEGRTPLTMDRKTVRKIMTFLGDTELGSTRKFLRKGGLLESGYKGDAGRGLQKMLTELGCDIVVDGAVGAKTIEALHQVQERFGLEKTDKVNLAAYDTLVPLLLLTKGLEVDDVDLQEFYDTAGGEGCYLYLKGCALEGAGKYYSAMEAFENSTFRDSQERAAACVQKLPESGELWRNPDIPGSDAGLTFTVNGPDDSRGMYFEIYNMEDQPVSVVFVRGSGSATTYVPTGTYHIKDGSGSAWYGPDETFGPDGYYEYLTFSEDPDTEFDAVLDYGKYELAINVSEIAEGATSVGASSVGWKDTFGDTDR